MLTEAISRISKCAKMGLLMLASEGLQKLSSFTALPTKDYCAAAGPPMAGAAALKQGQDVMSSLWSHGDVLTQSLKSDRTLNCSVPKPAATTSENTIIFTSSPQNRAVFLPIIQAYALLILPATSGRCRLHPKQPRNVKETHRSLEDC